MRSRLLAAALTLLLVVVGCGDDSAEPTTAPRPTSGVTVDVGGDIGDVLAQLIADTEELRGLEFIEPPQITLLSQEELGQHVADTIDEELDPADLAVQQAWFELLGLLDPTIDLGQALKDLYAEQVGGLYDGETRELLVADAGDLTPLARTIVVHELVHALVDQHYQFDDEMERLDNEEQYESAAALQALAEGDATYFQLLYLQTLPDDERVAAVQESLGVDTTVMDSLPEWLGADLTFPYEQGFGFAKRILADRGMEGLNQAYELLPTTTEQIMHPEAYFRLEPARPVEVPPTPLDGYEVWEEGVLGEWNLRLYLLEGRESGEALIAAAGWGGDTYRLLWNGEEVAFVYVFEGDTPRDAEELSESLVEAVPARMAVGSGSTIDGVTAFTPGADFAYVRLDGSRVLFVAASDPAAGQALVDLFPPPADDDA